jgi:hypothetical protein
LFAKNLEHLLWELCQKSDVSHIDPNEFLTRFDALRRYGKLPHGRENRARELSGAQMAAAIFGLVPVSPGWAGHAAAILTGLRPVGSAAASFRGAVNLTGAVELLLTDGAARRELVSLSLSVAEHALNANGSATLAYQHDGVRQYSSFVSGTAVSLLQPGAQAFFDAECSYAPVARSVRFNREFFDRIAREVERSRAHPTHPAGDGSEYDAEEAGQAREKALRVVPQSRFLNVGVDTQVTWPNSEMLVQFDRYHFVLMPKTKDHAQSIHIDLYSNCLTAREARTVINRFLSILTWCDDQFAVVQDGWSGNPVPVAVPRRDLAFATTHHWIFDRQISSSDEVRRALALYRDGRNAEATALVSYAVLNYFKIIEIRHTDGAKAKRWIASNFAAVHGTDRDDHELTRFIAACGGEAPEVYIYSACRLAVAHASVRTPSDADAADEIERLHTAASILRRLARLMISQELGVSTDVYSGN